MSDCEFTRLVDAEYSHSLHYALRMTHNRDDAEDAIQNARIRAWRWREHFDTSKGPFGGWFRAILVNVLRDHHRLAANRNEIPFDPEYMAYLVESDPGPDHPSAEATFIAEDDREKIQRAVKDLPDLQREVITMHVMLGVSMKDIQETLKITRRVIRGARDAGLETLKARLAEQMETAEMATAVDLCCTIAVL